MELFFFLMVLLAVASAWFWGPFALRRWRRARVRRQPFPAPWRNVLRRRMPYYARLPSHLQLELKKRIQVFIAEKPFIGCQGLEITDEMRVLVAAQANLLQLNGRGGFPGLRQVLVYPGAFVVERAEHDGLGLVREGRRVLSGESWQQGQVILSWDDVLAGAADPDDGANVVIHEFAHQLDQESGAANGAPFLGRREHYARWAQSWGAAFARLQRGEPSPVNAYGAVSPAEFFACASESFFETPRQLIDAEPALYRELVGCYGVDPLAWQ